MMETADFDKIIRLLVDGGIEFVLIGGLAANAHGSARVTYDLDIVYSRSTENLQKIVESFAPLEPYLRGAPPGLPFRFDEPTLAAGLNFTFKTMLGPIDLLGEALGAGKFDDLKRSAIRVEMYDRHVWCASLEDLIRMKTAAGRPKDFEVLAELHALRFDAEQPLDET